MRKQFVVSLVSAAAVFPVLAMAQAATSTLPDPGTDLLGFAGAIFSAFQAKNWGVLAALGLAGLVFLARTFGAKALPFLGTDRGGALLSLLGGLAMSVFTAATAPGTHTFLQVLGTGLLMSVTASGAYALLKKLFFPSDTTATQALQAAVAGVAAAPPAGQGSAADVLKDAAK